MCERPYRPSQGGWLDGRLGDVLVLPVFRLVREFVADVAKDKDDLAEHDEDA